MVLGAQAVAETALRIVSVSPGLTRGLGTVRMTTGPINLFGPVVA